MVNRGALAFVVVAVVVSVGAASAHAHEIPVDVVTIVEEVAPPTPGLTVQVASSVTAQLVLENDTGEVVEILDDEGRAFLRLDGQRVEANFDVAAWYRSNDPFGQVEIPDAALDDHAADDWREVATGPAWGWFDHRLHRGAADPPDPSGDASTVLDQWVVPLRVGSRAVEVRGVVDFRPPLGVYDAVITEQAEGLVGQVVNGSAPALSVEHTGQEAVMVLGIDGEPLMRFSAEGVEANLTSATWHQIAQATSSLPPPAAVTGADDAPVWERVAHGPRFTWIDPRLALPVGAPDDPSFATSVASWRVPVRAGEEPGDATSALGGEIRWVPAAEGQLVHESSGSTRWGVLILVVVVAAVAGAGAGHLLRRRRS